jgi:Apea-like HEPN
LLLGRDTKNEISHQLAVRAAHVGGGGSLEEKRLVVETIGALYNVRSKIVHSGSFNVSDEELDVIREYATLTLFIIIDKEPFQSMSELSELDRWFEVQLLSGALLPKVE